VLVINTTVRRLKLVLAGPFSNASWLIRQIGKWLPVLAPIGPLLRHLLLISLSLLLELLLAMLSFLRRQLLRLLL